MPGHAMDEPITRRDLHEALDTWTGALIARLDERFAKIDERFAKIDERFAKIDERFAMIENTMATKDDLAFMATTEDVARHAKATQEYVAAQIAMIDEKYKDLPARVERLERAASRSRAPRRR